MNCYASCAKYTLQKAELSIVLVPPPQHLCLPLLSKLYCVLIIGANAVHLPLQPLTLQLIAAVGMIGLQLLEFAIRYRWLDYSAGHTEQIRSWIQQLAGNLQERDPLFIRNKIAQLWAEVSKRCWGEEWMDMDALLCQLWSGPAVHKELVLCILEMLSDDIFSGDDTVVAVREGVLSKASVEIFTPAAVLTETFPNRQAGPDVRCGSEGWLARITDLLNRCLSEDIQNDSEVRSCAVRALGVLYSLLPWVVPNTVTATQCAPVMCEGLRANHIEVQKVSCFTNFPRARY